MCLSRCFGMVCNWGWCGLVAIICFYVVTHILFASKFWCLENLCSERCLVHPKRREFMLNFLCLITIINIGPIYTWL
jgi:hypothetical protein